MNTVQYQKSLTDDQSLDVMIEGVLFYKAEPVKKKTLADMFGVDTAVLDAALSTLSTRLATGGTRLITTDVAVQLVAAPELSDLIQTLKKEELRNDIGKAGAETLAIILYRGPLARAEIDRIRGVNSTFILRNLLVRGLVERRDHPTDSRSYTYAATPMLLGHLGISRREELPDFATIMDSLEAFERNEHARAMEANVPTET